MNQFVYYKKVASKHLLIYNLGYKFPLSFAHLILGFLRSYLTPPFLPATYDNPLIPWCVRWHTCIISPSIKYSQQKVSPTQSLQFSDSITLNRLSSRCLNTQRRLGFQRATNSSPTAKLREV